MSSQVEFLEDWMDAIEALPNELQRNYTQIKELDTNCSKQIEQISSLARDFVQNGNKLSIDEKKALLKQLNTLFKEATAESEDKVRLAVQTYDLVDKHIRKLDEDLMRFEDELTITGMGLNSQGNEQDVAGGSKQQSQSSAGGGRSQKKRSHKEKTSNANNNNTTGDSTQSKKERKTTAGGALQNDQQSSVVEQSNSKNSNSNLNELASAANASSRRSTNQQPLPPPMYEDNTKQSGPLSRSSRQRSIVNSSIDPNEPTYCICNKVSYGLMVGCDSPDCEVEWFHYECVGLTSPPVGKWYCPGCRKKHNIPS
ncbi:hypothetical protein MP228_008083 [Amoeboaphelidium protococcarum]|nr:hypothetical protein MP228_008083 [Amoeboaphelidium protococcarum]